MNGIRIIESLYLEEDGAPYQVRRTWRERLLSRPWQPMKAMCTVVPKIPARNGVMIDAQTMVIHPQTLRAVMEAASRLDGQG